MLCITIAAMNENFNKIISSRWNVLLKCCTVGNSFKKTNNCWKCVYLIGTFGANYLFVPGAL